MRWIPAKADVVVIAAVLAGTGARNLLAQTGNDIVFINKTKHPRLTFGAALVARRAAV